MSVRVHRPSSRLLLAWLCVLVGAAALPGPRALALTGHFPITSFGFFSKPGSVAANGTTGDVYVLDLEAGTVSRFTSSGEPAPFASIGGNVLSGFSFFSGGAGQVAVDNSSGPAKGDLYVADTFHNQVKIFNEQGELLSEIGTGGLTCGVAVDPAGDLYVSTFGASIAKYVPKGNPVTAGDLASKIEGSAMNRVCNLAADGEGNVYSDELFGGKVLKFEASQFGTTVDSGQLVVPNAKSVGFDPVAKHLLVDVGSEILEYDSTLSLVGEFGPQGSPESFGVGVDPASGDVYVSDDAEHVVESFTGIVTLPDITVEALSNLTETSATLNATINPLGVDTSCKVEFGTERSYGSQAPCSPADLGAGSSPLHASVSLTGLTPGVLYHYRFVTSSTAGTEHGFDATVRAGIKPAVDSESSSGVTMGSATLAAQINPMFFPTSFHVEYGPSTAYGSSSPVPDSKVGSAGVDQNVLWSIAGLRPSTVYHYRFVATDAFGSRYGADQVFTTLSPPEAGGSCFDAAIRQEQSATYLPDCRAYELVSPAEKGSADIASSPSRDQAAAEGGAIKYWSTVAFGNPLGTEVPGAEYIARRGPEGWSSQPINPNQVSPAESTSTPQYVYVTPNLTGGVFYALSPLTPGHPNVANAGSNLYVNDNILSAQPDSFEHVKDATTPQPYVKPSYAEVPGVALGGASSDLAHVAFESYRNLTPGTAGLNAFVPKAYEWDDGTVRDVGVLPDSECGSPPCVAPESIIGAGAGGGHQATYSKARYMHNAISRDGSRVVFAAGFDAAWPIPGGPGLFMRIDGRETIQLNLGERNEPDPNGRQVAVFQAATPDLSKVFFLSTEALTENAEIEPERAKLYMYDLTAPLGHRLTLLSVNHQPGSGDSDDLARAVVGVSEDGSYVYFYGASRLIEGQPPTREAVRLPVYVWHNGVLRKIAEYSEPGAGEDRSWGQDGIESGTEFHITPDGRSAVFVAYGAYNAERAGVDNRDPQLCQVASGRCPVLYVYNYESDSLVCASCKPAGDHSEGVASINASAATGALYGHPIGYVGRVVTDDGRYVFFSSTDELLPQATNGHMNVYEFDTQTLQLHLISAGTCACDSLFVDASADGRDVFFTTRQRLVRSDIDTNLDLYDARIEGGISSQNQVSPLPCTGDACQGPAQTPPSLSVPASATFSGAGNATPSFAQLGQERARPKARPKHRRAHAKKKKRARKAKRSARYTTRRSGR